MIPTRCGATVLLIATACATLATAPVLPLWGGLAPGKYTVGFRTGDQWYPAADDGAQMRYRDYIGDLDDVEASLHAQHVSDREIVDLFDAPMYARHDATAVQQTFPLAYIVKRPGQTTADVAVIAEFLASHGYLIRAVGEKARTDPSAQFLHIVTASKSQMESMANGLLRYLQSSQRTR